MKEEVFYGKGMGKLKEEDEDLYIMSAKKELGVTRDEVVDVLKVVLLTSGMQPFNKALQIANKVFEE